MGNNKKSELCLKCLKCCEHIGVRSIVNPNNFIDRSFYELRGCKTIVKDDQLIVIIPFKCPHLTKEGCDIYEKRHHYCRIYDGREDPFMEEICLWGKQ